MPGFTPGCRGGFREIRVTKTTHSNAGMPGNEIALPENSRAAFGAEVARDGVAGVGCATPGGELAPGFEHLLVTEIGRYPKRRSRAFLALDAAAGGYDARLAFNSNT